MNVLRSVLRRARALVSIVIGERQLYRIEKRFRGHESIYNSEYYEYVDENAYASAPVIADSIIDLFDPKSILDIGCGTGALLYELRKRGIAGTGLEYSEEALTYCRERGVDVMKFDLRSKNDPFPNRNFDVVVSMEVAQQLPESSADDLVDLICEHGNHVVFTAATPGQGGRAYVNQQPHRYWIEKFRSRGFQFLEKQSAKWRQEWEDEVVSSWYSKNLMLFSDRAI